MMLRSTQLRQTGCTLVASLITIHSRRSIRAILVQRKNIDPLVVTITLNFCMLSLHNLTIFFFVCMSDIVHSHAEHVEKKRRVLRGNTMSCRHRSMVGSMANPPHLSPDCNLEEDICSKEDSDAADHSYLPPKVFALPWHDDVSHIMHMLPCSAYF